MSWSPEMQDAAAAPVLASFACVEIVLPGGPLRLLAAASMVTFGGSTFVGEVPTYGVLGKIEAVSEGYGAQAPRLRFVIYPPTRSASAALCQPSVQSSEVSLWWGLVDLTTGVVLEDPELLFVGKCDVPKYMRSGGKRAVEFDCASAFEDMFVAEEGQRLTKEFLAKIDPTAKGLDFVNEVERQLPWGSETAKPGAVAGAGSDGSPGSNQLENPAKAVARRIIRGW